MKKSKKVSKIIFRVILSVIICILMAIIPTVYIATKSPILDKFGANKSEYQGVLEIWHIDTFEGGIIGKSQYLKACAIDYETKNKGLYFMIKNMTETQCMLALKNGQRPAMFSFGVGIGQQILEYLAKLNISNTNIRPEFLQSGTQDYIQYALPWCRGVYSLVTTQHKLQTAKQESTSDLASIATSCGYTKILKNNKIKTIYSLAFGSAGYVCPQRAYSLSYKNIVQNATSIDSSNLSKTSYGAYCDFIEGKASILLGSQRDVARIENRISQGKIADVVYQHLPDYTDLVQYIAIAKTQNKTIYDVCQNFMEYMTSDTAQQKLSRIGMFSINKNLAIYSSGEWQNIEQQTQKMCIVENVFTDKNIILANKQSCIDTEHV